MKQREFTRLFLRADIKMDFYNILINYFGSESELERGFLIPCDYYLRTHFSKGVYFYVTPFANPSSRIGVGVEKIKAPAVPEDSPVSTISSRSGKLGISVTKKEEKTMVFPTAKYNWAADTQRRANGLLTELKIKPNLKTVPVTNPIYILSRFVWLVRA